MTKQEFHIQLQQGLHSEVSLGISRLRAARASKSNLTPSPVSARSISLEALATIIFYDSQNKMVCPSGGQDE